MSNANTASQLISAGRRNERDGSLDLAKRAYEAALALEPTNALAMHSLGFVLYQQGDVDRAAGLLRASIALAPDVADFRNNLGIVLALRAANDEQWEEARQAFMSAIAIAPKFAPAYGNFGIALQRRGDTLAAREMLRRAVELKPDFYDAMTQLAMVEERSGDADAAIACYRRILDLRPDDRLMHGNLCLAMNCSQRCTAREIFDEHRRWAERHYGATQTSAAQWKDTRARRMTKIASRRLRLGYISSGFREYPGARFMAPVISNHDHAVVEVFCYDDVKRPDAITSRFKLWAEHWREISKLNDEQAVEVIRRDELDILVEHIGHMGNNRLGVFARRAAPVQMTYPGYPGTTGLGTMDYCITDDARAPAGSEAFYTERLLRIDGGSQCYDPTSGGDPTPNVGPLPVDRNRYITFGCFSRLVKMTPSTLDLWAGVMATSPDSRLLLFTGGLDADHPGLRQALASRGVSGDRITLLTRCPRYEFLNRHSEADVMLDTFPYHGHTTTLDALWMGVPTVSMMGTTRPAMESGAVLSAIGLSDLAADSASEFVAAAARLAADVNQLRSLRENLRSTMQRSILMDGRRLAEKLERIYLESTSEIDAVVPDDQY